MSQVSRADIEARVAELEAENARLKAAKVQALTLKVSEKTGAISVYGLSRFPVTLYRGQMERLLNHAPQIQEFITKNADKLKTKE